MPGYDDILLIKRPESILSMTGAIIVNGKKEIGKENIF